MSVARKKEEMQTLFPEVRFIEFRHSKGWKVASLGDLADISARRNSDCRVDRVLTNSAERGVVDQGMYFDRSVASKKNLESYYIVEENSYIYNPRVSSRAPVGPVSRNKIGLGVVSPLYLVFKFKAQAEEFYDYYFKSGFWYESVRLSSSIGARHDRMAITVGNFMKLPVLLPEEREREKVSSCLKSVDDLISAESRKLDALYEYKLALLDRVIPSEFDDFPNLRFPDFSGGKGWEFRELSNCLESLDAGVSVNSGDRPAGEGEYGVLRTSCVTNGIFNPNDNKVIVEPTELKRAEEFVRGGTIIISRMNTPALVGGSAFVEEDAYNLFLPDRLWAAKSNGSVGMRYLSYVLSSRQGRLLLSRMASGSSGSMKNISKLDLLAMKVCVPSSGEQKKIEGLLYAIDKLIPSQIRKIELLECRKMWLMRQLFPSFVNN